MPSPAATSSVDTTWQLVECRDDGQPPRIVSLSGIPVTVGRVSEALLCIQSPSISKTHAEIRMGDKGPVVHDQGSTNGTHVNGKRVQSAKLCEGDVVQFANTVFRVSKHQQSEHSATVEEGALPWAQTLLQFDQLMTATGLVPHFQPIVRLDDETRTGYEMLARSDLDGLQNPGVMFATAAKLNQESSLSELLRREGVATAAALQSPGKIFLNTHPKEIDQARLVASLRELRASAPALGIVIEIHEAAVTDRDSMRSLCDELRQLDMQLAYDDFGAGQARLDELAEVPPDFLKFDIKLIREIDRASDGRLNLIRSLVEIVQHLGVVALAEGVETRGEADACRQLGFELAQGFFFGRPAPVALIV